MLYIGAVKTCDLMTIAAHRSLLNPRASVPLLSNVRTRIMPTEYVNRCVQ